MIFLPIFFQKYLRRCNFNNKRIRVNEQIRVSDIRLIEEDGKQVGIIPVKEALKTAAERGLDLVEISSKSDPPVCKIMDYGKYRYQMEISRKIEEKEDNPRLL